MIDRNNISMLSILIHNEHKRQNFIRNESLSQIHHYQTFPMHLMKGRQCQELAYYLFLAIRR